MGRVRLQEEPFSLDDILRESQDPSAGGVTFYVGTVRGDDDGRSVDALDVEAYPEMAVRELERIRTATVERFDLVDATVVHRTGRLSAGEPILVVALFGRHRQETFAAIEFFMDELKRRVPIWKKEEGSVGSSWILGEAGGRTSS
jgi:molybdopterin synthase catalytic subunit